KAKEPGRTARERTEIVREQPDLASRLKRRQVVAHGKRGRLGGWRGAEKQRADAGDDRKEHEPEPDRRSGKPDLLRRETARIAGREREDGEGGSKLESHKRQNGRKDH